MPQSIQVSSFRLAVAALACCLAAPAAAEDVVYMDVGQSVRSKTKITGQVVDYTGKHLIIRIAGAAERTFPAERVYRIETERSALHREADEQFARRRFSEALQTYREAQQAEPRRWVRRQILAQMIWCCRNLDQWETAGTYFLLLFGEDPDTPYFDCIPLAWTPREPTPALEQRARSWLESGQQVAVLMGTSHLISTAGRGAAVEKLDSLRFAGEPRVAALAKAQHWRVQLGTATERTAAAWSAEVQRMPEALRAGPYYVLGAAWTRALKPEQAALSYLRVPVLYPHERALAARCLLEAGLQLERVGQTLEARKLYEEIVADHPASDAVGEARSRLRTE